ncbi:ArsR family transcriptional regulator [Clostridium perfringens]|nr:replication/maintenance protein RepL [Clostridium perfringens]HBI6919887.1 replication/maintenance protein RepL [Clostridium perfringens]HBI7039782.1 replication/maintenance protein RepL [Clostridium perfringens]
MMALKVGNEKSIIENKVTFEERTEFLNATQLKESLEKENERKSKFKDWYQVNREHSDKLINLAIKNPKANALLYFLLDNMDGYNAVQCSSVVFKEALGMSRTTSYRYLKYLADNGFIAILKSGTANIYVINDDLAWSSWGKNKKYCKFPANVILSATENKDYIENLKKVKSKKTKALEVKKIRKD